MRYVKFMTQICATDSFYGIKFELNLIYSNLILALRRKFTALNKCDQKAQIWLQIAKQRL